MTTHTLNMALVPRDGFFFKDGRGWYTSDTNRAGGLAWPFPSTLRGALTTACGYLIQEKDARLLDREEWLKLKEQIAVSGLLPLRRPLHQTNWNAEHRLWPVPKDALFHGKGVVSLQPHPPSAHISSLGSLEGNEAAALEALWHPVPPKNTVRQGKPTPAPTWWSNETLVSWLSHAALPDHSHEAPETLRMVQRDDVHVLIQNDGLTAKDGGLYTFGVLETLTSTHQWALAVRGNVPNVHKAVETQPISLGGKGKPSISEVASPDLWQFPERLGAAFAGPALGLRLVMVTPGLFPSGWCLPGFRAVNGQLIGTLDQVEGELILRAAIVPRPLHVSGWDQAEGKAKATRRLVPPGSVYFLHKRNGQHFTGEEARALWLAPLGLDQDDGLGRVVPGVWNPDQEVANALRQSLLIAT